MNDGRWIKAALLAFVVVVTLPFWFARLVGARGTPPSLAKPVGDKRCVEDAAWMRANHMRLLGDWRTRYVRGGVKEYTSESYGTKHAIGLTATCLGCHGKKKEFCDRCHLYADVAPDCWGCHNDKTDATDG